MGGEGSKQQVSNEAEFVRSNDNALAEVLESTLLELNKSLEQMENIIDRLETGEGDWEESVRLIAEANQLAISSSQKLDRVVQDVVLNSSERAAAAQDEEGGEQQSLELP